MNAINIDTVLLTSEDAPQRHPLQVLANLVEEVGELAVCINRPAKAPEPLIGEAADVINCVLDIVWLDYMHTAAAEGKTYEQCRNEIANLLNINLTNKCAKWRGNW